MFPRCALVGATLVALAAPAPAHAQFGGLMKKAKNAAAEAAGRKAADKAVEKATGTPAGAAAAAAGAPGVASTRDLGKLPGEALTEETFAAMLTGLRKANSMLDAAAEDNKRMGEYNDQSRKLAEAHPGEREFYDDKSRKVNECRGNHMSELNDKRREAQEKRAETMRSNPTEMARVQGVMMKYSQQLAAAQQKNDMAEYNRLTLKMTAEMTGEDPIAAAKADTASATRACGALPARPQWMAQVDSLDGLANKSASDQRKKEESAGAAGAAAGGMPEMKFALLRERIEILYRKNVQDGDGAIVNRHRNELKALERALY